MYILTILMTQCLEKLCYFKHVNLMETSGTLSAKGVLFCSCSGEPASHGITLVALGCQRANVPANLPALCEIGSQLKQGVFYSCYTPV